MLKECLVGLVELVIVGGPLLAPPIMGLRPGGFRTKHVGPLLLSAGWEAACLYLPLLKADVRLAGSILVYAVSNFCKLAACLCLPLLKAEACLAGSILVYPASSFTSWHHALCLPLLKAQVCLAGSTLVYAAILCTSWQHACVCRY